MAFKFYTASPFSGTTEFDGQFELIHPTDLSDGAQDFVLYWADVEADPADSGLYQIQAAYDFDGTTALTPGTDPIQIRVTDDSPGSGHETTEIKLALSSAGLDSAVAGATLDVATTITSGTSNAVAVHIRVTNAVTTPGNSTELGLQHNGLLRQPT